MENSQELDNITSNGDLNFDIDLSKNSEASLEKICENLDEFGQKVS